MAGSNSKPTEQIAKTKGLLIFLPPAKANQDA